MPIHVTTKAFARVLWLASLLAVFASAVVAQSTDVAWPSPVRTNEVSGAIPARDLGDPRVTDHFFAFIGTPGDVLITVDSRNLNGDVDVFTASGLRPLLKFTVYAGNAAAITKSIYLRQQEELILRVEGRTPNDDEAVYRIHFGGAFEPITSGPLAEHEDAMQPATTAAGTGRGGRRVSSVGARIEEPPSEVAETPKPQPTPNAGNETAPDTTAAKAPARNSRTRPPVARRTRPTATPKPAETTARTGTEKKPPAEGRETETPAAVTPPARRGRAARAPRKPATAEAPVDIEETGPRLIIETTDGTLVDRSMAGVRRVTVENGQVVVIGMDGKIKRIPLASVVRMTISQ